MLIDYQTALSQYLSTMYLMQIFIPTRDNEGNPFEESRFTDLREELTNRFRGVTIYARTPVQGIWRRSEDSFQTDQMVIYEVIFDELEMPYWKRLKLSLEKSFSQEKILMRYSHVAIID